MSSAETETMSTGEEDIPRSALPGVHTALRDPNLQIRLLLLDAAGSDEDIISATLEVWDKEATPPYNAISYVCGDAHQMQVIAVNGIFISVRHNCHYALWQTRLQFPQSRVWIDAVCIKQLDLEEKTAQVMMMHEIYSKANQVLACIGPSDEHSDAVMQAMDDLDAVVQDLSQDGLEEPTIMDLWHPAEEFCDHYNEFATRPYFSRVWILQELAGGQGRTSLLCGQDVARWYDLVELSHRLYLVYTHDLNPPYEGVPGSTIFDIGVIILQEPRSGRKFPGILTEINRLQCEDVRDRIYSTRVLFDWSLFGHTPPVPDYQISPVELALRLLDNMIDTSLDDVRLIAQALDLMNPLTISQVLEELKACRLDPEETIEVNVRDWYTELLACQMVQQDIAGVPLVLFRSRKPKDLSKAALSHVTQSNLSDPSREILRDCKLSPMHHDGSLAAVTTERMQAGDIIIEAFGFDLVLRPHDDGDRFVIIGGALVLRGFELAYEAPFVNECFHHLRSSVRPDHLQTLDMVKIAVEMSNVEALAAVVSYAAFKNGDYSASEYLDSGTFGVNRAGSHVWDVTTEKMWNGRTLVGTGHYLPCVAHRAGDYYWKYQKFFWYSVLMGAGTLLSFSKEDSSYA